MTRSFSQRQALLFVGDVLLVNVAVLAALRLWAWVGRFAFTPDFVQSHWLWFLLITIAWVALAWLSDLYDVLIATHPVKTWGRIGVVIAGLAILYLVVYFISPRNALPRLFFLFFSGNALVGTALWRWTYATIFRLPNLCNRVLIVGAGCVGRTLAQVLSEGKDYPYQAVGFVDDAPEKQGKTVADLPVLGNSTDLTHLVQAHRVDEIAVAITHEMRGVLFQALMDCHAMGVNVVRMSDLYEQLTRRVPVEHINKAWVLNALNDSYAMGYVERAAQRLLNIASGVMGLISLGVVLPFVALAVRLDDGGPLFYTQVRAGRGGKPFRVVKFRTMRPDAEGESGPQWAQKDDKRITRVGRFLRKMRLDELPQVINVLRGEMSVVGPRPERPEFIEVLEKQIPFYRTRLVVKPGLTGWAQIHYGYGNTVEDALIKLQYDLYYIRHRSLLLDLYIIFKTIGVILRFQGT